MADPDVHALADEIAQLMAQRFGGARRGTRPDLKTMLRRRGGALPRRQRKAAQRLATLQGKAMVPRVARQIDTAPAMRDHAELMKYLRPLGAGRRWTNSATNIAAAVMFGLMILAAVVLWVLVWRGHLG
ncbi:hypothetical protein [Paracoccus sphaerophysae]|uniref:Uncharacterized protein n=1 Tax=Paracoccus sphaerophysae TaxID=690417 RepID=A0A099FDY9_9RHOB|nr:hypothetical protein [Paracoccus sphaerophysae]KGJ08421.1 hypothetical protein IC63_05300 [Paracoccus sphaerophysae]